MRKLTYFAVFEPNDTDGDKVKIPSTNSALRSIYDPAINGYWFSVIDLCAILTDSDHKTARGYWKRLKYKLTRAGQQVVTVSHHLKWQAPNGKYHYTEAVNFKDLIYLIQTCPSPKANTYRLWLADMMFEGISMDELEKEFAKLGEESAKDVAEKYKNNPDEKYLRLTTSRKEIHVQE